MTAEFVDRTIILAMLMGALLLQVAVALGAA